MMISLARGIVAFVAVGDGSATTEGAAKRRRKASARVVVSGGGHGPRCYRFEEQCEDCGEFRGKINVLPQGAAPVPRTTTDACRFGP